MLDKLKEYSEPPYQKVKAIQWLRAQYPSAVVTDRAYVVSAIGLLDAKKCVEHLWHEKWGIARRRPDWTRALST